MSENFSDSFVYRVQDAAGNTGTATVSITVTKPPGMYYEYDELGRRVTETLPLGQRASLAYDEVGRMVSATDLNGDTINFV